MWLATMIKSNALLQDADRIKPDKSLIGILIMTLLNSSAQKNSCVRKGQIGMDTNRQLGADYARPWRCHDVTPLALVESGDSQLAAVLMNCSVAMAEQRLYALIKAGQMCLKPVTPPASFLQFDWLESCRLPLLECLLRTDAALLPDIFQHIELWLRHSTLQAWVGAALRQPDVPAWTQQLAGRLCRRWLQLHDASSLLQCVGANNDLLAVNDANVHICHIWALIMRQQFEGAEQALHRLNVHNLVQDPLLPLQDVDATVSALQAWLSYNRDLSMSLGARLALLESCMEHSTLLQPMMLNQYVVQQYCRGNIDIALHYAERAAQRARSQGNLVQYQLARGWMMTTQFMMGNGFAAWLQIQSDYDHLQKQQAAMADHADSALEYALAIHRGCQSYLCYETNQIQVARQLLGQSRHILQKIDLGLPRLLSDITQAKLFLDQGDLERAEVLLASLDDLPETLRNPRIQAIICYERMRTRWCTGRRADDFVQHYALLNRCVRVETLFQDTYQEEHLFWLKSRLLAYLIDEDFASASELALKGVIKSMGLRCYRHLATFYLFKALSEYRLKREADAMASYNQALLLCQQSGYRRVLSDDGSQLWELWQTMQAQQRFLPQINQDFLHSVQLDLQRFDTTATRKSDPVMCLSSDRLQSLTDKEIKILTLLAEGLCNKKIANRASIALTTVKWHLQNIFSKLDARNRTEAVLKAQAMHLVDTFSGR